MENRKRHTDNEPGQGNAFQINDEPATDIEPSDDRKTRKPEGNAFQINGDADEDPKSDQDAKR